MELEQFNRLLNAAEKTSERLGELNERVTRIEANVEHLPTSESISAAIKGHMQQCQAPSRVPWYNNPLLLKVLVLLGTIIAGIIGAKVG